MKKLLKVLSVVMVIMIVLCAAGCGKKEDAGDESQLPSPTSEATPVPTPEPTPEPVQDEYEEIDGYTIKKLDKTMYTTANLNVRNLPNTEGIKIGLFKEGDEVQVIGQCEETGWYRVLCDGQTGYSSDEYLKDE